MSRLWCGLTAEPCIKAGEPASDGIVRPMPLVGLLLIGVAAWGKEFGIVSSLHIIGGVIAIGFFLLLIAIIGFIGAISHHQVMLFIERFLNETWTSMGNVTRREMEKNLNCCGWLNTTEKLSQYNGDFSVCIAECKSKNTCDTCGNKMLNHAGEALKILGGVGLFFSFTEILGVWLAFRYRNQKDPRANPSAFL
ncbi:unnamed protein product [Ranitomeya imitator]|uniref:Tetraspanin-31 n=1 Tax=Ranitomeya imitator TaxID=111125 RepID=A0ABN9LXW5_9NEOB|nr:unnamed protein product [Ranitomeya imitator]